MKKFIYFFFAFSIIFSSCTKEEGCTDPLATNFNVDAENDDGSCVFGVAGGEWITESIVASGSISASLMGIPIFDSIINFTETNPDSLDPYKLVMNENGSYMSYDNSDILIETGTWSATSTQLTMNFTDGTLIFDINSLNKNQASFSTNIIDSENDDGFIIETNLIYTLNTNRTW